MEKYKENDFSEELYDEEELSELESHVLAGKAEKNPVQKQNNPEIIKNVLALSRYLLDNNVKWYRKSLVIATLAYYIKPKGTLKNWDDFFDFLDDVGAVESAVKFLGKEIKKYY